MPVGLCLWAPQGCTGEGTGQLCLTPAAVGCPWPRRGPQAEPTWPDPRAQRCLSLCRCAKSGKWQRSEVFQILGNSEHFSRTSDQKKTQIPFIKCTYIKQTNWRHEDVFRYYSSFIYSLNTFNLPPPYRDQEKQRIDHQKKDREKNFRM